MADFEYKTLVPLATEGADECFEGARDVVLILDGRDASVVRCFSELDLTLMDKWWTELGTLDLPIEWVDLSIKKALDLMLLPWTEEPCFVVVLARALECNDR